MSLLSDSAPPAPVVLSEIGFLLSSHVARSFHLGSLICISLIASFESSFLFAIVAHTLFPFQSTSHIGSFLFCRPPYPACYHFPFFQLFRLASASCLSPHHNSRSNTPCPIILTFSYYSPVFPPSLLRQRTLPPIFLPPACSGRALHCLTVSVSATVSLAVSSTEYTVVSSRLYSASTLSHSFSLYPHPFLFFLFVLIVTNILHTNAATQSRRILCILTSTADDTIYFLFLLHPASTPSLTPA